HRVAVLAPGALAEDHGVAGDVEVRVKLGAPRAGDAVHRPHAAVLGEVRRGLRVPVLGVHDQGADRAGRGDLGVRDAGDPFAAPEGSVEAFLADHRQELFPDSLFEDLFPSGRGRPSVSADVMASVMVLQSLEGLSDRDAARALTDRISWKVACGLALDSKGFHPTVLTYWRNRLRVSDRPERVFDAVRSVVEATGVLKHKT